MQFNVPAFLLPFFLKRFRMTPSIRIGYVNAFTIIKYQQMSRSALELSITYFYIFKRCRCVSITKRLVSQFCPVRLLCRIATSLEKLWVFLKCVHESCRFSKKATLLMKFVFYGKEKPFLIKSTCTVLYVLGPSNVWHVQAQFTVKVQNRCEKRWKSGMSRLLIFGSATAVIDAHNRLF